MGTIFRKNYGTPQKEGFYSVHLEEVENPLKDLTTEQIEELKVWIKSESTTQMFDYVSKNRLLEAEVNKLQDHINSLPTWADFNALKSERDSAQCNLADMGDENAKLQAELTEVKEKLKIAIDSAWESE